MRASFKYIIYKKLHTNMRRTQLLGYCQTCRLRIQFIDIRGISDVPVTDTWGSILSVTPATMLVPRFGPHAIPISYTSTFCYLLIRYLINTKRVICFRCYALHTISVFLEIFLLVNIYVFWRWNLNGFTKYSEESHW